MNTDLAYCLIYNLDSLQDLIVLNQTCTTFSKLLNTQDIIDYLVKKFNIHYRKTCSVYNEDKDINSFARIVKKAGHFLVQRSARQSQHRSGTYHIHVNGCETFKVIVENKTIFVYENGREVSSSEDMYHGFTSDDSELNDEDWMDEDKDYFSKYPLLTLKVDDVFIGKSPWCKMVKDLEGYCGHGPKYDGNCILFKLPEKKPKSRNVKQLKGKKLQDKQIKDNDENTMIVNKKPNCREKGVKDRTDKNINNDLVSAYHSGIEYGIIYCAYVRTFTVPYRIVNFVSHVLRAHIPYPYMVDERNNLYLFVEKDDECDKDHVVMIEMNEEVQERLCEDENVYWYYYHDEEKASIPHKVIEYNRTLCETTY